ncbi:GNAT family N-acetyltransferase [Niallia circulans]|uniref:GNAT family N-acetyltransferase n=1 Tax=Niallia circulans TaxID=1397 RepID=UPI00155F9DAE|nr:GNAT family N-acetyltransferase [Niallia circulans]NRG31504.1 GNAT family N-acetyltransferase [Niallia circulans]
MDIKIKEVNSTNYNDIISLSLKDSQKTYIEPPLQCLQDAKDCRYYKPVGLYVDDILIGFAMYGYFPNEENGGRVWLDRYLIDRKYQGQGYGKILLNTLIEHLGVLYNCKEVYLSIYEDNVAAINLYKLFGFHFNGEKDLNGELVMVKKL